jgi:hypothetical protein
MEEDDIREAEPGVNFSAGLKSQLKVSASAGIGRRAFR